MNQAFCTTQVKINKVNTSNIALNNIAACVENTLMCM